MSRRQDKMSRREFVPCELLNYDDEKDSLYDFPANDTRYIDRKVHFGKEYTFEEDIVVSLSTRKAQKRAETLARRAAAAANAPPQHDEAGAAGGAGEAHGHDAFVGVVAEEEE